MKNFKAIPNKGDLELTVQEATDDWPKPVHNWSKALGRSIFLFPQPQQYSFREYLYFCIPKNEKLLEYWDIVADRLFKIRHCMNIEGIRRELPLFQPPIEPGLLVQAVAAGIDISSALSDLNAPLPYYRFNIMAQKAKELCEGVKNLGSALLSAHEKRDAEKIALLRADHEVKVLDALCEIKKQQIEESRETLQSIKESREVTKLRYTYYKNLAKSNRYEKKHLDKLNKANVAQLISQAIELGIGVLGLIPDLDVGTSGAFGSPVIKARFGGINYSTAAQAFSRASLFASSILSQEATLASIRGGHERRWDEWKLQEKLAEQELKQIDKQIIAAQIRLAMATTEMANHDKQVENAKELYQAMQDKYTNQELYNWMISQILTTYRQSYNIAYDMAKKAEKAYQFELGITDSNFIKPPYWDNLKNGLLAGEKLLFDIRRMEVDYLDNNRREYEITKHISLAITDPIALLMLKENGECFVNFPEVLFDIGYPGHYMRRIKSVSLTIPCVAGAYSSVNCTLTLLGNRIRKNTNMNDGNDGYVDKGTEDTRFQNNVGSIQSIATSSAQNDSGLFELNFRDERYLPFEGTGVISQWRLELPKEFRQFDYNTISDVIFHINYTARDGGDPFKEAVNNSLQNSLNRLINIFTEEERGLTRILSTKCEFSNDWHRFMYPPADATTQTLSVKLTKNLFPFMFKDKNIQINSVELVLLLVDPDVYNNGSPLSITVTLPDGSSNTDDLTPKSAYGNQPAHIFSYTLDELDDPPIIAIKADETAIVSLPEGLVETRDNHSRLKPEAIEDMLIILNYTINGSAN